MSAARASSWSIVRRLSLLYVLLSSVLLVVAAIFLYWLLQSNLRREDNSTVGQEIHVLRVILRERPDDPTVLRQEVRWEGSPTEEVHVYERIMDDRGKVLLQTQGITRALPKDLFPSPIPLGQAAPSVAPLRVNGAHRKYRVLSAWAQMGNDPTPRRLVQVGLDVTHEEGVIHAYGNALVFVVLGGIMASIWASVLVARKGMEPLADITRAAQKISATQLHERLPRAQFPVELHPLAAAFNEMLNRLEDSFTRLGQFSADLAHELRTPINNLMGEAEVALSRPGTATEYRQVLESALEEYQRLSRMIESLLFLARAEHGAAPLAPIDLNARIEIEAVCEFHEAVAQEQQVVLACEGSASILADPILLRRALSNVLSNALRYTSPGGRIELLLQDLGSGTEIRVRDTGSGIGPEHLPRLFDRFYRADAARASHGGAGLGLSIVRSIMALHGGEVTISSTAGVGTEVRLWFPRQVTTGPMA